MSSIPSKIQINEEGPREGFQFEKAVIPTARKIALIDSLSETGLNRIQIVSFVNPKAVPGMADAEEVVEGFNKKPGISWRDGRREEQSKQGKEEKEEKKKEEK